MRPEFATAASPKETLIRNANVTTNADPAGQTCTLKAAYLRASFSELKRTCMHVSMLKTALYLFLKDRELGTRQKALWATSWFGPPTAHNIREARH